MRYVSTRGVAPVLDFGEALLAGLADDGGLYVPEAWPVLGGGGRGDYVETAVEVMSPYVAGSVGMDDFGAMVADAYATFKSMPRGTDTRLLTLINRAESAKAAADPGMAEKNVSKSRASDSGTSTIAKAASKSVGAPWH